MKNKKIIISMLLMIVLTQCTILKRKYTNGYYIDFVSKKNSVPQNVSKKDNKIILYDKGLPLKLVSDHKELATHNNLKNTTTNNKTILIHQKQNVKHLPVVHNSSIRKNNNENIALTNLNNEDEASDTKNRMFKLITWSSIDLLIFILVYSILYNHLIEILTTVGGGYVYGCLLVFIPTLFSIIGLVLSIVHYSNILNNPHSTKKQKIWASIIILLSILFHPLMVFLYTNLIIII